MIRIKAIGVYSLVALLLPLLFVYVVVYVAVFGIWRVLLGVVLRVWFWRAHAIRGRHILFVYSESPNWREYIEARILPRIGDRAVVLNWSERRHWKRACPWEARFFWRFAGDREFNPIALVFHACGRIRAIRFHQPFLDFKHGKDAALRAAEAELFELVNTE